MDNSNGNPIDMHVHVGLKGDRWPEMGGFSEWYQRQLVFKIFLMYGRIDPDKVCDTVLHDATVQTLQTCGLDQAVCLALDPVYDNSGGRQERASHVWVANEYVLKLRAELPTKVLFGASVHPYDPKFEARVRACVDNGAVLLKWLPSAQQINLADKRVPEAMKLLATAKNGRPLPLLLHVGVEYAIPSTDATTSSYDFLSWNWSDRLLNSFRGETKWRTPDIQGVRRNLDTALKEGATIIFAHCGLPYFASGVLGRFLEHSDFQVVREYLQGNNRREGAGLAYADVSAFCTPFRQPYFKDVATLPAEFILFGSDFPTPAFDLYEGVAGMAEDFAALLAGQLDRVLVPGDNLLDVNNRVLRLAFPGHPMFSNFAKLIR